MSVTALKNSLLEIKKKSLEEEEVLRKFIQRDDIPRWKVDAVNERLTVLKGRLEALEEVINLVEAPLPK